MAGSAPPLTIEIMEQCPHIHQDTWYLHDMQCGFQPLAHVILSCLLSFTGVLCVLRALLVYPVMVPRAKPIVLVYILAQSSVLGVEIFGIVYGLVADSPGLQYVRWTLWSSFSTFQFMGTGLRTNFFLVTVARTQQSGIDRYLREIKLFMLILVLLATLLGFGMSYAAIIVEPRKGETLIRGVTWVFFGFYFASLIPTTFAANKLMKLIKTMINFNTTYTTANRQDGLASAKKNLQLLEDGMKKTYLIFFLVMGVLAAGAVLGLNWIIVHVCAFASQLSLVGALSYLETCRVKPTTTPTATRPVSPTSPTLSNKSPPKSPANSTSPPPTTPATPTAAGTGTGTTTANNVAVITVGKSPKSLNGDIVVARKKGGKKKGGRVRGLSIRRSRLSQSPGPGGVEMGSVGSAGGSVGSGAGTFSKSDFVMDMQPITSSGPSDEAAALSTGHANIQFPFTSQKSMLWGQALRAIQTGSSSQIQGDEVGQDNNNNSNVDAMSGVGASEVEADQELIEVEVDSSSLVDSSLESKKQ